MRNGIKYDWNALASLLANEDSNVQNGFFNTFAQELLSSCGSTYNAQMQAHHICGVGSGPKLTENARNIFACFGMEESDT